MDTLIRQLSYSTDIKVYRPQFKRELGSVNASILLNQIIYWWHKMGYKSFYKFKEPCQHPLYSQGESWCEELEFSKKEFDNALKKLKEREIISSKRDNNNKVWYTVSHTELSIFLNKAYNTDPVDTGNQEFKDNLHKIVGDLDQSASTDGAKLEQIKTALGYVPPLKNQPKSPLGYVPVYPLWAFTTIYRRLQQETNYSSINLAEFFFEILKEKKQEIFLEIGNKNIPKKPLDLTNVLNTLEPSMNLQQLTKIVGGNTAIAEKLQQTMPTAKTKNKSSRANSNAVFIAWKEAYGSLSDSFVGNLTKKDEAMLKHISADYPAEAVGIINTCLAEWSAFGNEVIRMKGLSMAPQMPTIAFLSANREVAHSFYSKTIGKPVAASEEQSSPAMKLVSTSTQGFTTVDDIFGE